jgi:hypothetical protein
MGIYRYGRPTSLTRTRREYRADGDPNTPVRSPFHQTERIRLWCGRPESLCARWKLHSGCPFLDDARNLYVHGGSCIPGAHSSITTRFGARCAPYHVNNQMQINFRAPIICSSSSSNDICINILSQLSTHEYEFSSCVTRCQLWSHSCPEMKITIQRFTLQSFYPTDGISYTKKRRFLILHITFYTAHLYY